ncbi:hypothetical protein VCRA2119O44_390001 [Vibrio crassostreae]|nr:hypothetical protein VCRA2119O47_380001 [Vibrio crassostreae]CAK2063501.1 hypothetical protein VCRA2119O44_390001 [Vibrio crassostreae]CAK2350634.1 hypothetical protein VCRA2119O50_380001 [Vibrio crassostreae]CAK3898949.1 hypothetical protein VCRA218O18_370001 [Vibrio crassostreae]
MTKKYPKRGSSIFKYNYATKPKECYKTNLTFIAQYFSNFLS